MIQLFRRLLGGHAARPLALLAAALLCAAGMSGAASAQPPTPEGAPGAEVDTGHIKASLAAQTAGVTPGSTVYVALKQVIDPHWHTYWRNPGDAGEPTTLKWTLPPGWKAGEIVWARPDKIAVGPLLDYGYSGTVLLPVPVEAPADAPVGSTVTLKVAASFLVCEEICVPEAARLQISLPVVAGTPAPDPRNGAAVSAALDKAPKDAGLAAAFQSAGGKLSLAVTGAALKGADMAGAYFYPYSPTAIEHAQPQAVERGPDGLTLALAPGVAFQGGKPLETLDGVLALPGGAYEVSAAPGAAPAGAAGLGAPPAAAGRGEGGGSVTLPLAVGLALLGGLILNLMPCVFPILSMKAAQLAAHAHAPREARSQGLAFLAGVLATFLALAGLLIALKGAGQAVGWGFQLQNPVVVGALALVMLAVALNLSGVFEIGMSAQGAGSGLAARGGLLGAFFTGVLAVVVAAPCTAPFMATAMGFALTQSAPAALLVFAALGLGLALPFVALSLWPAALRRFPRPGTWMETLRRLLAFPMYGAAAWLLWVLSLQAGAQGLAALLAAAVVLALAAWLFGRGQTSGRGALAWRGAAAVAAIGAVALLVPVKDAAVTPAAAAAAPAAGGAQQAAAELPSEPWSEARVATLQAEGRPVFVNFTAAWCVTCQVNDKVALSTAQARDAFQAVNAAYLVGDWTNRDAEIARALDSHGRAGVPLYLLYPAGGGAPKVLPQLLTAGGVAAAVRAAAKPSQTAVNTGAQPSA